MQISGSTALITGASRGLGRHFAKQLIDRGAKVYATARHPEGVDLAGAVHLRLDITDPASVAAAAGVATDVSLLVNNAGISLYQDLVPPARDEERTNAGGPDSSNQACSIPIMRPMAATKSFQLCCLDWSTWRPSAVSW